MTVSQDRVDPRGVTGADDLAELEALIETVSDASEFPLADRVERGVVVYDADRFRAARTGPGTGTGTDQSSLLGELVRVLADGPGIYVVGEAFDDAVVDRVSEQFEAMIDDQRSAGTVAGDHFAVPGANDRVWNALEKLALRHPLAFVDYYANDVVALAASAWLGPGYQITSQVNVVNPGGAAQSPHCDYHLGFQGAAAADRFPSHVHRMSPMLTLQAAVAHVDMSLESGPTMYLPHSQKFTGAYRCWERPEVVALFEQRYVQLPMSKGDAVVFNPALLHGAGHNRTGDVRRMANLLQVSSPFGRAMETVDRHAMCRALYPALVQRRREGMSDDGLAHAVAAAAEGYPFPTNLDRDTPVDGLAPPSQADVVSRAVRDGWDAGVLEAELDALATRRLS